MASLYSGIPGASWACNHICCCPKDRGLAVPEGRGGIAPVSGEDRPPSPCRYCSRRRRLASDRRALSPAILERDLQPGEAPQSQVRAPHERIRPQGQLPHAPEHRLQGGLPFDPPERRSKAEVRSPAECHVAAVSPAVVLPVGIRETF